MDAAGKFLNHEFPYVNCFSTVVKYWVQPNPQRAEKEADRFQLPVLKTEAFLHDSADVVVWLGHASFFIRLGGITFLLDPVLGNLPAFGKRLSELPLANGEWAYLCAYQDMVSKQVVGPVPVGQRQVGDSTDPYLISSYWLGLVK